MTKPASREHASEVRERAVRMVFEHTRDHASQRAAIGSIAAKINCTAETLRGWVRQAEREQGTHLDEQVSRGCRFSERTRSRSALHGSQPEEARCCPSAAAAAAAAVR